MFLTESRACLWQVAMAENELAGYLDLTMIIEQAKSTENLVYRKSKSKVLFNPTIPVHPLAVYPDSAARWDLTLKRV